MKVSNPLTIIAIFAGLAETLATVALVQLPSEIQSIFVYFVMAFPLIIVLLFFYILYHKNIVLYAPSDYENDTNYLEANDIKANLNQTIEEVFQTLNEHSATLTPEEINKAKETLTHSVKDQTMTLRERIIEFLTDNPTTTKRIGEHVGLDREDVRSILFSMKRKGIVVNNKVGNSKAYTWTLCV